MHEGQDRAPLRAAPGDQKKNADPAATGSAFSSIINQLGSDARSTVGASDRPGNKATTEPNATPPRLTASAASSIPGILFDFSNEWRGAYMTARELVPVSSACGFDYALSARAWVLRKHGTSQASIMLALERAAEHVLGPLMNPTEGEQEVGADDPVRRFMRQVGMRLLKAGHLSLEQRAELLSKVAERFEVELEQRNGRAPRPDSADAESAADAVAEELLRLVGKDPTAYDFVRALNLTVIETKEITGKTPDAMLLPGAMVVDAPPDRDVLFIRLEIDELSRDMGVAHAVAADRLRSRGVADLRRAAERVLELLFETGDDEPGEGPAENRAPGCRFGEDGEGQG